MLTNSNGKTVLPRTGLKTKSCPAMSVNLGLHKIGVNGTWMAVALAEFVSFVLAVALLKKAMGTNQYLNMLSN